MGSFSIRLTVLEVEEGPGTSVRTAVEYPQDASLRTVAYFLTTAAAELDPEGFEKAVEDLTPPSLDLDTSACECCGVYPCDPTVCAGFQCCPRCY